MHISRPINTNFNTIKTYKSKKNKCIFTIMKNKIGSTCRKSLKKLGKL